MVKFFPGEQYRGLDFGAWGGVIGVGKSQGVYGVNCGGEGGRA